MERTSPYGGPALLDIPRALEQIGDADALRSMMPMLEELLVRDLPQIAQFMAAGDVRAANPLLHSLKGCMPIFCVPHLCEHLAQVEQLSKAGDALTVSGAYAALEPQLQRLLAEVQAYLAA